LAYYWMGNAHKKLGQYPEAVAAYKKLFALEPTWHQVGWAARTHELTSNRRSRKPVLLEPTGIGGMLWDYRYRLHSNGMRVVAIDVEKRNGKDWQPYTKAVSVADAGKTITFFISTEGPPMTEGFCIFRRNWVMGDAEYGLVGIVGDRLDSRPVDLKVRR
ncbi:MAG: tetratricopeptide repeat protein, partial [Kiritimatiellia bacterium]|nr:tetratricopeptide repeat protein [Kiritimatiellia bacterium]